MSDSPRINVYTDGACKGNPGPAGAGVVIVLPDGQKSRIGRHLGRGTNNHAELMAVEIALQCLHEDHQEARISIHTDSQLVIGWLRDGWKVNSNQALISNIKRLLSHFLFITFVKVKAHSGHALNEEADHLAQGAALEMEMDTWSGQVREAQR